MRGHGRKISSSLRDFYKEISWKIGGKKISGYQGVPIILRLLRPGGALGYFLGGYVPPGTPNWHPVLKKNCLKIVTPF